MTGEITPANGFHKFIMMAPQGWNRRKAGIANIKQQRERLPGPRFRDSQVQVALLLYAREHAGRPSGMAKIAKGINGIKTRRLALREWMAQDQRITGFVIERQGFG